MQLGVGQQKPAHSCMPAYNPGRMRASFVLDAPGSRQMAVGAAAGKGFGSSSKGSEQPGSLDTMKIKGAGKQVAVVWLRDPGAAR